MTPKPQPDNMEPATSQQNAANSDNSAMGYAASPQDREEIARLAYEYYKQRQDVGAEGSPEGDWYRAENDVRRRSLRP